MEAVITDHLQGNGYPDPLINVTGEHAYSRGGTVPGGQIGNTFENILTERGILLRVNRSIQVEGAFGVLKSDYKFSHFLTYMKITSF